jgi:hypothetical protein
MGAEARARAALTRATEVPGGRVCGGRKPPGKERQRRLKAGGSQDRLPHKGAPCPVATVR